MVTPWRIELLGRLQAVLGNRTVCRFRYQKSGVLLAYLAFYSERPHPREELQELLWPGSDPEASQLRLRVVLASLRRQLEPPDSWRERETLTGAVLCADRRTVRLNAAFCITDVALFERALQAAERAADPTERMERWAEAVELYRGELLPGRHEEWVLLERQRLAEAFQQTVGALVEQCEAAGDRGRALQYARRALAADSLREEAHHTVIRLLVAAGEREAARAHFQELERLLAESAGMAPAAETRALVAGLIEAGRSSGRPHPTRRASPSSEPAAESSPPPLDFPAVELRVTERPPDERSAVEGYLPLLPNRFYGRETEVVRLCQLLGSPSSRLPVRVPAPARHPRLVTLTGAGGSGKTRLAVETSYRLWEPFGGAVWFVALADLRDPRLLPEKLKEALRLPGAAGHDLPEQIAAALSGRHGLLILDNFEQLLVPTGSDAGAEAEGTRRTDLDGSHFVCCLLDRVPNLACLVTSRQRLGLTGEREFPVSPLPVPVVSEQWAVGSGDRAAVVGLTTAHCSLTTVPSVQLFLDRAQAIRPDFRLTPQNVAAVAELCRRLEGLPLALELAAGRVWVLTPPQMLARLSERFELLVGRQRDAGARHHSLRAALEWSYDLLSPELQRFFAHLSVFRGGWTVEAAEAVCGDFGFWILDFGLPAKSKAPDDQMSLSDPIQNPKSKIQNPLDLLEELRECSLVVSEMTNSGRSGPRALDGDAEEPVTPAQPAGLAASIGRLISEETVRFHMLETLREFAAEQLSPTEQQAIDERHTAYFLALAEECDAQWTATREERWLVRMEQEFDNLRAALARCQAPEGDGESALRLAQAMYGVWHARGNHAELRQRLVELLSHPHAQAGTAARAWALQRAGSLTAIQCDAGAAAPLLRESLALFRSLNDRAGIAAAVNSLALTAVSRPEMQALYEESLEIGREVGDAGRIADQLYNLSLVTMWQGEYGRARALVAEAMEIWSALESPGGAALALSQHAALDMYEKDLAAARRRLEAALELFRGQRTWQRLCATLQALGRLARITGDLSRSRSCHTEELAAAREVSEHGFAAEALLELAALALEERQFEEAERLLREALPTYREAMRRVGPKATVFLRQFGAPPRLNHCLDGLAWLAWRQGNQEETQALHAELLAAAQTAADFRGVAAVLDHRARLLAAAGPLAGLYHAARLLGAADMLRHLPEAPSSDPLDLWQHDRCLDAVRAGLDEAEFTAGWTEGQQWAGDRERLAALLPFPLPPATGW